MADDNLKISTVDDNLTLSVEGDVSLNDLAIITKRFGAFINALSQEVGGKAKVDWFVEEMHGGSAHATFRSPAPLEVVERVVGAYGTIGKALEQHKPIPYSNRVQRLAIGVAELVKGSITSIRFETPSVVAVIGSQANIETPGVTYAFGEVRGTVETLTSRSALKFTLYDLIFDKPITCYLQPDQKEIMRGAWGKNVVVSGLIGREPDQRRAVVVKEIMEVTILEDVEPGSFRRARGIIPSKEGSEPSEAIIRRLRDEW